MDITEIPNNIGVTVKKNGNGIKFTVFCLRKLKNISPSIRFKYGENYITCPTFSGFKTEVNSEIEIIDKKKNIKIERNFYQSVKNKNKLLAETSNIFEFNKDLQEDFNHQIYDDNDIKELYFNDSLSENEEIRELSLKAIKCDKALRNGSFRADLFRYYILYTRGGVWLDDKSILRLPLTNSLFGLEDHDGFLIYGSFIKGIEIALIASRKGSPILKQCLLKCLSNIEERAYYNDFFLITGPTMCKTEIDKCIGLYKDYNYKIINVFYPEIFINNFIVWQQTTVTQLTQKMLNNDYYPNQWSRGAIYTDNNYNKPKAITRLTTDPHITLLLPLLTIIIIINIILFFKN